ncbi:MAG: DMT family transporter [Candidatus Dormibacteria bacterium]
MEPEDYLMLAALAGIWGASFLFIKVAVGEMAPPFMVFTRVALGALAVLPSLRLARVPMSELRRLWLPGLVVGVFNAALPYSLFAFGERLIDSSLAGILNATMPLWTALMAPLWMESEKLRGPQYAGLGLGFAGAVLLARPHGSLASANFIGGLLILAATLSYAFSTHFSRRVFQGAPAALPAFLQCGMAAVVLVPLAVVFHPSRVPGLAALGSIAALGIGGTGLAMILAFRLIRRIGANRTSVVTYLLPPSAVFWGTLVLHERLRPETLAALLLILGGVFLITRRPPMVAPSAVPIGEGLTDEALAEARVPA